jgi:hypothetical protein
MSEATVRPGPNDSQVSAMALRSRAQPFFSYVTQRTGSNLCQ